MQDPNGKNSSNDGDSIRVFIRVRPPDSYDADGFGSHAPVLNISDRSVSVQSKPEPKVYTFDQVIKINATQDNVFSSVGRGIIESCVRGYNGTIFAYGQTGSGKTYTMLGPTEDDFHHELRGIIPRSFEYLFHLIKNEEELHGKAKEFLLKGSFLEIYNEQIFDLLETSTMFLHLRENIKKGVYVDGLTEMIVTSASEAYQVLNKGWINRRVASTSMNRESSRSHAVFTLTIESKELENGVEKIKSSVLNLVDLAGSERQKDTKAAGQRLKEAGSINKSLSVLGNCIMSLVDIAHGKSRHIPYRDSKLTFLLRDSLGGNAKTHIMACIHADARCLGETLSTLSFARRAKMIKNKAVINEDSMGNVMALQAEIRRLKEMLSKVATSKMEPGIEKGMIENQSDSDSTWKRKFIDAMRLREKTENDKRLLMEKMKKLEEVCSKKENIIQSNRMILKFRETNIKRLEQSLKKNAIDEDACNSHMKSLKEEIAVLTEQVNQHPMVAKYAMEIQWLKGQLSQHKKEAGNQMMKSAEELEQTYAQLMADNQDPKQTPSRTPKTGENISTASLEKHKAQVDSLNEEIAKLKQELKESNDAAEKKQLELESEVASQRKTVEELNTVIGAHQLKSKLERDAHIQTVKNIVTPTKAKYVLRNRTILNSDSTVDNSIVLEGDEGILDEQQPLDLLESQNEALREELKQSQEACSELQQRIEEYEQESINMNQQVSKLDHQNTQLKEILSRERVDGRDKMASMEAELQSLTERLEATEERSKMHEGEASDLKILLKSSDKDLKDMGQKRMSIERGYEEKFCQMERKLMEIESEFQRLEKENNSLSLERTELKDHLECAQVTKECLDMELSEMEGKLHDAQMQLSEKEAEIMCLTRDLESKKQEHEEWLEQIKMEGDIQEQMMRSRIEELKQQLKVEQEQNIELSRRSQQLSNQLTSAESSIDTLTKQTQEQKDVIADYLVKMNEQTIAARELKEILEEKERDRDNLSRIMEENSAEIERLKKAMKEAQDETVKLQYKHHVEVQRLYKDVDELTDSNLQLQGELASTHHNLELAQNQNENLRLQLEDARSKLKAREEELTASNEELNQKLREAERRAYAEDKETELMAENEQLKVTLAKLNKTIETYESNTLDRIGEITNIKKELSEVTQMKENLQHKCQELETKEFQMNSEKSCLEDMLKEERQLVEELRKRQEEMRRDLEHAQEQLEKEAAKEDHTNQLRAENQNLIEISEQKEEEIIRLRAHVKDYHASKDSLTTELEKKDKYIRELEANCEQLLEDNTALGGHTNNKQKIHHLQKIKMEREKLQEVTSQSQAILHTVYTANNQSERDFEGLPPPVVQTALAISGVSGPLY